MTRPAPYSAEVEAALNAGRWPIVYVFTGPRAHDQAERRRIECGQGSALVLPDDATPEELTWPHLDAVILVAPAIPPDTRAALHKRLEAACTRTRGIPERHP